MLLSGWMSLAPQATSTQTAAPPASVPAAVALAEKLTDQGDPAGAQSLLVPLARSLPDRADLRRALARAYLRGGGTREALAEARRAVELDPGSARGHDLLGSAMAASGNPEKAIVSFERAISLHPGDAGALAGLASAYATLSDPRAEQAYERAIAADRRSLRLGVDFAGYLWRDRQYDRGNAQIEKVVRQVPDNAELRVYYGISLAEQRRFADAAKQFDEARRRGNTSTEVLLYLGSALREAGRLEEATARLREAVALAPDQSAGYQSLGSLLLFRGQPGEALGVLE